jgi:uncharacterized protein (DUF2235 family)
MPRCLIVCIDGTWNSSADTSKFSSFPTNVERISKLLINDGKSQRVIYRHGVGTQGFVDRVVGGAWGSGSAKAICDGYRFLCENYEAGDRLALFGFSRGAFAVRSIIGVLARVGVLRAEHIDHVPEAVSLYRRPLWMVDSKLQSFTKKYCYDWKLEIMFVGVWDTVIRYGPILVPIRAALELGMRQHFGLFDQKIPALVKRLCHALALDESRAAFWPWRASAQDLRSEQVEEMWFAGSHSDVGGGYRNSSASEFSLRWISERAANEGLQFHQMPPIGENSHLAPLNPSRVKFWRILMPRVRIVEDSDRLHDSVEKRMQTTSYRPAAKLPKPAQPS